MTWSRAERTEYQRRWRAANPEKVAASNAKRRVGPVALKCSECGAVFEGRPYSVVCGRRRCTDARYRRLHPAEYAAKRARKDARRRARRKASE